MNRQHVPICTVHQVSVLNKKYDAYYCPFCNKWLEAVCDDPQCEFCSNRPLTPLIKKMEE